MSATDPHKKQRARLPTDYIGGTCEGRRASPSNPNQTREGRVKEGPQASLSESVIFRCTPSEKAALVAKSRAAGLPNATLMREALGLTEARRRKPVPRVDPKLTFAIARVGGNLNQLSRWINGAVKSGRASQIDALKVAAQLVVIERQLSQIVAAHTGGNCE
ncbi:plasmid mobilization relaxosome protein MobC [Shimia thalassica]|uniref:plasmid mobilization protein n=1 Tax=Shimia thalassica TaxID=1715693 RepID=UPI002736DDBC|nr:plasmid mobilization relaxosome protein MobC [Shimia thalassica]MDP2582410.1 plasmid mobilization relaxosome protein MobC [Shimia thalassica]